MRLSFLAAATAAAFFLLAAPATAQTESEPACNAGDAEACFYTGAEYAQGIGAPDGCATSGVLIRAGEGNLEKSVVKGVEYQERACAMGHVDGCEWALGNRISATSEAYDLKKPSPPPRPVAKRVLRRPAAGAGAGMAAKANTPT